MAGSQDYILINAYEELVKTNVRDMMAKTDMCQCEKCFLDVCALVMNNRFAKYVTTRKGAVLAKIPDMNIGDHTKLVVTITIAMELVRQQPQHGE